jgi:hypothetical protein
MVEKSILQTFAAAGLGDSGFAGFAMIAGSIRGGSVATKSASVSEN